MRYLDSIFTSNTAAPGLPGYRACTTQIAQRAVARLGSPVVTALNGPVKSVATVVLTASR